METVIYYNDGYEEGFPLPLLGKPLTRLKQLCFQEETEHVSGSCHEGSTSTQKTVRTTMSLGTLKKASTSHSKVKMSFLMI